MKTILYAVAAAALALSGNASAENDDYCGKLRTNHYGPYDYRTDKDKLPIVENAHFTKEIEQGIRGKSSYLGSDLDYTLQAFPNHHRALVTLVRIALRDKTVHIPYSQFPVECYFDRAYRFAPDDGIARATYASYLYGVGRYDKALAVYQEAVALDPDNPMINYNLGLAYLKKNDFEHANQYAHKAYEQGYPLPGLKNQLVKAGKWTEKVDKTDKTDNGEKTAKADKAE
jgi:tetratricopeptide (TPR) repeat protein